MQFDLTKFLLCRAVAENAAPDIPRADRISLVTSMLNMDLVQSAVIARVLAENQAAPAATNTGAPASRGRLSRRRRRGGAAPMQVNVPSVRHLSDPEQILAHLHQHKLHPKFHRETVPELKTPRVLRQWPEENTAVAEGSEINVLLLMPEDGRPEIEVRSPTRK